MCNRSLSRLAWCACALAICGTPLQILEAEEYTLAEPADDSRVFAISARVKIDGKFQTPLGKGKASDWNMKSTAEYTYRERRLGGSGRDAEAFRSLRRYNSATSQVKVGDQVTSMRLHDNLRHVVVQGKLDGVQLYCPKFVLRQEDLDLLSTPGDSLAMLPLLPRAPVAVDEEWTPDTWCIQQLTDLDAVVKTDVVCKLESVAEQRAVVTFKGTVEGAAVGASARVELDGSYTYDLDRQAITELDLKQVESRSVGAVSPGMQVTAQVTLRRQKSTNVEGLTDDDVAAVPLIPEDSTLMLSFVSPWGVQFQHDRNWFVYHQTDKTIILRRLEQGRLIAQCNVSRIASVPAGQHTPEDQFQADIQTALADRLQQIDKAEQLKTTADDKRFLYRVTASGAANEREMRWIYYLCTAPTGQQLALVFTMEKADIEPFQNRDMDIVLGLRFSTSEDRPTPADEGD